MFKSLRGLGCFRHSSFSRGALLSKSSLIFSRSLFATPISKLLIESTKASKNLIKPTVCSGCGSKFQKKTSTLPGYLPESASIPPAAKKIKTTKKYFSNDDLFKALSQMDTDLKALMLKENSDDWVDDKPLPELFNSEKKQTLERVVCQRCYTLQHHQRMSTDWKENSKIDISFLNFLQEQPRSVIIYVVDAFDLSGSLLKGIKENLIGKDKTRRVVLVLNKSDLMPKGISSTFLNRYIREKLYEVGLLDSVLRYFLVSAKNKQGLSQLVGFLQELGNGESDFYFVGCTNVGKSELINALVNMATERGHSDRTKLKLTTSVVPGTTMDLVKIPIRNLSKLFEKSKDKFEPSNFGVFDTPGIFNPRQLLHYLTHEELKIALPSKAFKPKTYKWETGRSLFLGGLARFDYTKGTKRIYVTVYSSLPIHMTSIEKADQLTQKMNEKVPTVLYPPLPSENRVTTVEMPSLIPIPNNPLKLTPSTIFKRVAADVCVAGVGWISLIINFGEREPIEITAFSRGGHGITHRKPLCPVLDKFVIQPKIQNITPPSINRI